MNSLLEYSHARKPRKWNLTAIECYKSGCRCSKCTIIDKLESVTPRTCRMKCAVLELVRRFGAPERINEYDNKMSK